jgi:hypothetical protein
MADDFAQAIRTKQQRISELERELSQLYAELDEWRGLLGVHVDKKKAARKAGGRRRPIRERSTVWWAYKVIKHAAKPVQIDALVEGVQELSGLNVRKSTLVSNLSRYVANGDTFTRPEPGRYGLRELDEGVVQSSE